jgi:hypothetical protein
MGKWRPELILGENAWTAFTCNLPMLQLRDAWVTVASNGDLKGHKPEKIAFARAVRQ